MVLHFCVSVQRSLAAQLLDDTTTLLWPAGMPLLQVWLGFLLLFIEEVFWKGVRKGSRLPQKGVAGLLLVAGS